MVRVLGDECLWKSPWPDIPGRIRTYGNEVEVEGKDL